MKMTNYSQIMCLFIMLFFLQTQTVFAKDQSTKEKNEDLVLLLKVFTYSGNLKQAENDFFIIMMCRKKLECGYFLQIHTVHGNEG